MHTRGVKSPSRRTSADLPAILAALVALPAAGCTLLVNTQLSDKPADGGGAGGQGGGGGVSSSSSHSSSSSGHGAAGSSSSGPGAVGSSSSGPGAAGSSSSGIVCPNGFANCDGIAASGCNVNLDDDPANCGACKDVCMPGKICVLGKCK
jgi:hypothetical protein